MAADAANGSRLCPPRHQPAFPERAGVGSAPWLPATVWLGLSWAGRGSELPTSVGGELSAWTQRTKDAPDIPQQLGTLWVPPPRAGAAAPLPGVKHVVGETAGEAELINKIS